MVTETKGEFPYCVKCRAVDLLKKWRVIQFSLVKDATQCWDNS